MRICVLGDPEDLSAAYISWLVERRGAEVVILAENELGLTWSFHLSNDPTQSFITIKGTSLLLNEFDGAFVRLNPTPAVHESLGVPQEAEPIYVLERRYGIHWLLNEVSFPVVNRPYAGRSNSSKPYQMMKLKKNGFNVPRWIATNDEKATAKFITTCSKGAIYKASSGLRSQVRLFDDKLMSLMAKGTSPTVVQEYVEGVDVRIHVIGKQIFASQVQSQAIDYRFERNGTKYSAVETPSLIQLICLKMAASEGLVLAGFDFRRTPDDEWFCLEMNPVPTFLPYEAGTGQPIGDAIVDFFGEMPKPGHSVSPLFRIVNSQ